MLSATIQLVGLKQMLRRLDGADKKVKRKVLRGFVTKGGRLVAKDVKKHIPTRTKRLKKAIASTTTFRDGTATAKIGARKGKAAPTLHLNEKGTAMRVRKKGGSTGVMPAKPTLKPALKRSIPKLKEILKQEFAKHVT